MFGLEHFQTLFIKRLALKATNVVIITGIGVGIGSAILLSLLRYIFGKSPKLEINENNEDEVTPGAKDGSPMVLFITHKKPKTDVFGSTSSTSLSDFVSSSQSSSLLFNTSHSLSSSSSGDQVAVDAQVSEIEVKPLPELMLLDEECLRDKLKEDYVVLVIPRKARGDFKSKGDDKDEEDDTSLSFGIKRNSVDMSEAMNKLINKPLSLHRCSLSHLSSIEQSKEWSHIKHLEEKEEHPSDLSSFEESSTQSDAENCVPLGCTIHSDRELANTSIDCSYLFTSSDMKGIFENEREMNESLFKGGSDVMEKLADIEEKLCLIHVDAEDMMKYISAFRGDAEVHTRASDRYPRFTFETSTPTGLSVIHNVKLSDPPLKFSCPDEEFGEVGNSKNVEEWSFEDQLGDPCDDISF